LQLKEGALCLRQPIGFIFMANCESFAMGSSSTGTSIRPRVTSGFYPLAVIPNTGEISAPSKAITEVRRISHDLRPALLDDLGLPAALEHIGNELAERSGLSSTRLISYHFAGRDELMASTVAHAYQQLREHVGERLAAAAGPRAQLAAYIRAVVEFVAQHRIAMRALALIFVGFRDEFGDSRVYDTRSDQRAIGAVEQILRDGQESGAFRTFDPFIMGSVIQRSVDGLGFLLETQPDLDLGAYADELVETFDLATRRGDGAV